MMMKNSLKIKSAIRLWFGLFLITVSGLHAGDSILQNGQFQSLQTNGQLPVVWFTHPAVRTSVEGLRMEVLPEEDGANSRILRLGKTGGKLLEVTQQLGVVPMRRVGNLKGQTLTLKAQVRGDDLDAHGALVAIQFFTTDSNGQRHFAGRMASDPVVGTADWQDIEVKFDPKDILPAGEQLQQVEVCLDVNSNTGHADFRDVKLEIIDP